MGYYTRHGGAFLIKPELSWHQIKDSPFLDGYQNDRDVKLRLETEEVETPEGVLTRRSAIGVVPLMEDPFTGYHMVEHLQELVDTFPDHEFTGRFDCEGEDAADITRIVIRNRRVVQEKAQFYMPGDENDPVRLLEVLSRIREIATDRIKDSSDKIEEILPLVAEPRYPKEE